MQTCWTLHMPAAVVDRLVVDRLKYIALDMSSRGIVIVAWDQPLHIGLALDSAVSPDVVSCQEKLTSNGKTRARCRLGASMPVSHRQLRIRLCFKINFMYCYSRLTHGHLLVHCPFLTLILIVSATPVVSYLHHCVGVLTHSSPFLLYRNNLMWLVPILHTLQHSAVNLSTCCSKLKLALHSPSVQNKISSSKWQQICRQANLVWS